MKEPQIGHIGIYKGPCFLWWRRPVRWTRWQDYRRAKVTPEGEIGKVESFAYIALTSYRRRKAEWKTYYRGGTSC